MPTTNPSGRALPLGMLFPQTFGGSVNQNSAPSTAALPAGYLVEPGAQATGRLAQQHQAAVNQATGHAQARPLIHYHFMGTPNT
jgi:hypothetical protein